LGFIFTTILGTPEWIETLQTASIKHIHSCNCYVKPMLQLSHCNSSHDMIIDVFMLFFPNYLFNQTKSITFALAFDK